MPRTLYLWAPTMDHSDALPVIPEDFDGFLLDSIPVTDGIWSLYGFDDDRPLAAWSTPHAQRCVEQLEIARNRVRIAEWALADVQGKGLARCVANAAAYLARTRAELADWQAQGRRLEAARQTTYGAWKTPIVVE